MLSNKSGLPRIQQHSSLHEGEYYVFCNYDQRALTKTGRKIAERSGHVCKVMERGAMLVYEWEGTLIRSPIANVFLQYAIYGPVNLEAVLKIEGGQAETPMQEAKRLLQRVMTLIEGE